MLNTRQFAGYRHAINLGLTVRALLHLCSPELSFGDTLEIFTASRCRECVEAVDFLTARRATFTTYDLDENASARERYFAQYGHGRLPLIAFSKRQVRGFNAEAIENLIKAETLTHENFTNQPSPTSGAQSASPISHYDEPPSIESWPRDERERKSDNRIREGITSFDNLVSTISLTKGEYQLYNSVVRPRIEGQFVLLRQTPVVQLNETSIRNALRDAGDGRSPFSEKVNNARRMLSDAQSVYRRTAEEADSRAEAETARQKLLTSSFGQTFLNSCKSGAFMNSYRQEVMTVEESKKIEASIIKRCECLLSKLSKKELTDHVQSRLVSDFSENAELRPWFNENFKISAMEREAGLSTVVRFDDPYSSRIYDSLVECVSLDIALEILSQ